jgi:hypothetical protein
MKLERATRGGWTSAVRPRVTDVRQTGSVSAAFTRAGSMPTCRSSSTKVELFINLKTAETLGALVAASLT